ncbi:MAG: pyridoxal phosphate-dependent aminotransferase [Bdellovibrionia bacterium]
MPRPLSKKILAVQPSLTVALNSKANQMMKEGLPVLSFAVGEPHFNTPQIVVQAAIEALNQGKTKYGVPGGGLALRQAICAKLRSENHLEFSDQQIVVGIGAKEILFHLMLSLLNEGDEVLIPAPYWVSYADQVIAAGGVPVVIPLPEGFPKTTLDLALIERFASPKTVAILLNSPNNPVGYVYSKSELVALGNYLKTKDWWVVCDEIYEYLCFDQPHISLLEVFPELKDRLILINGLSKSFSMTGWRVGYGAGPESVMKLVRSLQSHSSTCLPGFIEEAARVAIQGGRMLMKTEIEALNQLREKAAVEFAKIPEVQFASPQGAFYFFLDFRKILAEKRGGMTTSFELAQWFLEKHHVALVPGEAFGAPGFIRFSYAVSESILLKGIHRMAQALSELKKP